MAILRKLTPELCDKCKYMQGVKENGCNYMTITGHSRIFENGKKTVPSGYCDKFEEGRKITQTVKAWGHDDMTMIYSKKGGELYERNYHQLIDRDDSPDPDT